MGSRVCDGVPSSVASAKVSSRRASASGIAVSFAAAASAVGEPDCCTTAATAASMSDKLRSLAVVACSNVTSRSSSTATVVGLTSMFIGEDALFDEMASADASFLCCCCC